MTRLGKLTGRQRRLFISQGRCFRCRKTGHRSHECKLSSGSRLAQLPVEILDEICLYLVYPEGKDKWGISWVQCMMALRLTCRDIDLKTHDFFANIAFRNVRVRQSYEGLQKLIDISESRCASGIKRLAFFDYDQVCGSR
jgi:hypothetical protein